MLSWFLWAVAGWGATDLVMSQTAQPMLKTANSSHAAATNVTKFAPSRACSTISMHCAAFVNPLESVKTKHFLEPLKQGRNPNKIMRHYWYSEGWQKDPVLLFRNHAGFSWSYQNCLGLSLDFLGPIRFVAATWQLIGRRQLWLKEI